MKQVLAISKAIKSRNLQNKNAINVASQGVKFLKLMAFVKIASKFKKNNKINL